jgi:tetratricopeptide (TPR) repeat protein
LGRNDEAKVYFA